MALNAQDSLKLLVNEFVQVNESTCEIDHNGNKRWFNADGELHRTDGPAYVRFNGTKQWHQNNLLHRTDGPAIEFINGAKHWFQSGDRHRLDGPAVEYVDGRKLFFVRGKHCDTFKEYFDAIPKENREAALLLIAEFDCL